MRGCVNCYLLPIICIYYRDEECHLTQILITPKTELLYNFGILQIIPSGISISNFQKTFFFYQSLKYFHTIDTLILQYRIVLKNVRHISNQSVTVDCEICQPHFTIQNVHLQLTIKYSMHVQTLDYLLGMYIQHCALKFQKSVFVFC